MKAKLHKDRAYVRELQVIDRLASLKTHNGRMKALAAFRPEREVA